MGRNGILLLKKSVNDETYEVDTYYTQELHRRLTTKLTKGSGAFYVFDCCHSARMAELQYRLSPSKVVWLDKNDNAKTPVPKANKDDFFYSCMIANWEKGNEWLESPPKVEAYIVSVSAAPQWAKGWSTATTTAGLDQESARALEAMLSGRRINFSSRVKKDKQTRLQLTESLVDALSHFNSDEATLDQFAAHLNDLYNTPEMMKRRGKLTKDDGYLPAIMEASYINRGKGALKAFFPNSMQHTQASEPTQPGPVISDNALQSIIDDKRGNFQQTSSATIVKEETKDNNGTKTKKLDSEGASPEDILLTEHSSPEDIEGMEDQVGR